MLKPICFMVMPYGRKATQAEAGKGPSEIDFNALWDKAYVPLIESLGYEAVRADQDVDALIINQMLERLYFADLSGVPSVNCHPTSRTKPSFANKGLLPSRRAAIPKPPSPNWKR
jgi:hypothetical protein